MKTTKAVDSLIDAVLAVGLAGIAANFLLPLVSAWCAALSLHLGRTLFRVHSIALGDFAPHIITGIVLGVVTASLIRHRRLSLALLPSILLCVFYALYFSFGPYPHPWGTALSRDIVLVADWLLLIAASLLCARLILPRRQANKALQATAAAPGS